MHSAARYSLEVEGVSVKYPSKSDWWQWLGSQKPAPPILRNINFQAKTGKHFSVYGSAGSGKTTLLRVLAGKIKPHQGKIIINGRPSGSSSAVAFIQSTPEKFAHLTVERLLYSFGRQFKQTNLPARVGLIVQALDLNSLLARSAHTLSTSQQLKIKLARAALSYAPIILLDDVADELGAQKTRAILLQLFTDRTVLISTRHDHVAEQLALPLILIQNGTVYAPGTQKELGQRFACPHVVNVWVEGVSYDLIRKTKNVAGVSNVQVFSCTGFVGCRVEFTLHSPRYVPVLYDLISQQPLIRVEEQTTPLKTILSRL